MSNLQKLIFYTLLSTIAISSVYTYVVCDLSSACPDGYICCLKSTGDYSCCHNSRVCCDEGRSCCSKTFLNEINLIEKSSPTLHPIKTNNKIILSKQNSTCTTTEVLMFLEEFLKSSKFYENTKDIKNCEIDFEKLSVYVLDIYNIIKEIKEVPSTDVMIKLFSEFSGLFHYTSDLVERCRETKTDIFELVNKTKEYITNEEYKFKFVGSMISNKTVIEKKVNEIKEVCLNNDYAKCGSVIGELFSIIFYVL